MNRWLQNEQIRTQGDNPGLDIGGEDGANIALVHLEANTIEDKLETLQRARIIAAAPAMLDHFQVIKTIATEPHHPEAFKVIRKIAEAMIAKATGGVNE